MKNQQNVYRLGDIENTLSGLQAARPDLAEACEILRVSFGLTDSVPPRAIAVELVPPQRIEARR